MSKNNARSITAQLWAMANKLRSTMDASDYKNYILPFMFYRYLSKRQDEYLRSNGLEDYYKLDPKRDAQEMDEYIVDIVQSLGYAIEPEHTWHSMIDKIKSHKIIASDFHELFLAFDKNVKRNPDSQQDFEHVFADVNLGDQRLGTDSNERTKALFEIVEMIDEFEFKDESGKDVLGDVYEYLIGEFAASAGKKGGEFYTPHEVSKVLAKLVTTGVEDDGSQFRVYDPAMGSGSLLLTVQKELEFGERRGAVSFFGQEINTTTYNIARMNLLMHDVNYQNMTLRRGDTLAEDWPSVKRDGIESPTLFDAVVANPPYSQKWASNLDKDPRFKAGLAPKSRADYAFIQHSLYHLDKNGTMAIVLPHGVLFRGGAEAKIREQLIRENRLDAVVGLPANLFYGTSIPTCILVFKGLDVRKRKNVLFIDASQEFDKVKNKNVLLDNHIDKIMDAYLKREFMDKYAYVASFEEIEDNDFNLNIPRYVDTFEEEVVVPLSDLLDELKDIDLKIMDSNNKLVELMSELTSEDAETQKELNELIKWFIK
jgi:type I restriction enzyme M protein